MKFFKSLGNRLLNFSHSIRFRLTMWFVLILAVVLVIFSVFIYFAQARGLQFDAANEMQEKFAHLQDYFRNGAWQNLPLTDAPETGAPLQQGDLLILTDTSGSVIQSWGKSLAQPDDLVASLVSAVSHRRDPAVYQETVAVLDDSQQQTKADYLFIITPVLRGDRLAGYLVIGSPSQLNSQLNRLLISLVIGNLVMLVIAFAGGMWLADRAMRPVTAITHTARNISESDLSQRINLRGRDELAELAGTFDDMLERLQSAFDRQRRFVADASHELRTPLTIINLEVGRVLSGDRTPEEYQRALHVVNTEGEHMTRLVNDLMTLARMDAGQAILQFEDVDLSDVTVEAVERMSALADRGQVRLEMRDLPELHVRGDRQYLVQMVSNLIENGVKYGGKTVHIETGLQNDKARLVISDDGPGIPPDHLPHLFDRFYRVDQARTHDANDDPTSPTGSGLGLSIVAWIVQSHAGEIRVQSKVGEGSTFEVILPLQKLTT